MGSVQQAVLEFDEAVQAPWRPTLRLVPAAALGEPARARTPVRPGAGRPGEGRPAPRPGAYRDRVARSPVADTTAAPSRPVRGDCARGGQLGRGRLRPTRRARRLAVALAVALGVALGSWVGPLLAGGDSGDLRLAGVSTVVVERGDTLWSVAASVAGDRDVRAVVDEIQQLNHLGGTALRPGQVLQLP